MVKCDHCGFGFAMHRPDATCSTPGCPFMERKRRLEAEEASQHATCRDSTPNTGMDSISD